MKNRWQVFVFFLFTAALFLNACAAPATEAPSATEESTLPAASAETEPSPSEETVTTDEESNLQGGRLVIAVLSEPDTLDPSKTANGIASQIMNYIGGSLVWMTPDYTYEPYLAESWTTSEDGLIWEFTIRQDVKFHDGTPLTAHDFAFAYTRALNPETASPAAGPMLGYVVSAEAVDDYTLRLTLSQSNAPILFALSDPGFLQPINQTSLESMGEDAFGRAPVGVGPFMIDEWATSERIVLKRNPDYVWGPASAQNQGPYNIETIEFVIIPEYATVLAGLESGEIDAAAIEAQDADRLEMTGDFYIFDSLLKGISPYVIFNLSKPPFDNVLVRKAFNLAVDKESLIQVAVQGKGEVQHGYLSSSVMGYWPGIEEIGYDFDLEQAKSLMQEAGYTLNTDGILEKDGQPLSLVLYSDSDTQASKTSQVLVEQFADLGVALEIRQLSTDVLYPQLMSGEYEIAISSLGYGEADLMYLTLHSSMIGGLNMSNLSDPDFDKLLEQSRTENDPAARQEILNQIQKTILEQAYVIPLYSPMKFLAVNQRWNGVVFNELSAAADYSGAYLKE